MNVVEKPAAGVVPEEAIVKVTAMTTQTVAGDTALTWGERLLGASAYLSWLTPPLGTLTRFLLFLSKGKTSRFVALHAVQAMLLGLVILLVQVPLGFLAFYLHAPLRRGALGMTPVWAVIAAACAMPLGCSLWMALSVLLGRPASAPVAGRWAREITDPRPGEGEGAAGPEDRALAGAAYVSILPFLILGPLTLYFWQRKRSRFVATHAVQALLLCPVLFAAGWAVSGLGMVLAGMMHEKGVPLSPWVHAVGCASDCAAVMLPWTASLWRGITVMRGRPGALPGLWRLATAMLGTRATAESVLVPSLSEAMKPHVVIAGIPYGDRVLASASYLAALGGFPLVVPGVVFLWRGRQSRFLGFHALQAVFLQVAMIPIMGVGLGLGYALSMLLTMIASERWAPLAGFLFFAMAGLALAIPSVATLWMGMCALRGQPRELPLLGRWAKAVMRDV